MDFRAVPPSVSRRLLFWSYRLDASTGPKQSKPRGVVFDMDGVLVESEPWMMEATARMFAELGYAVPKSDFKAFVGMGEDKIVSGAAAIHNISIDVKKAKARTYEIYMELIPGRLQPIKGASEYVRRCHDLGLALAVASSADRVKVEANLHELGIESSMFSAIVSGDEVARKKPAPDVFLEAARRLSLDPALCLVVEDAVAGVAAAKAAGCRCLAITSTFAAEQLKEADWIADNFLVAPDQALAW